MMRSLSSGVAGLRTHQTRMDVIGNNIANVNTYGFKSSRATFADVYYQNIGGASSGTTGTQGGKNPTQIGYGASVATIDVMQGVAGAASTDMALDVYIAGEGFLVSKDSSGNMSYTRLGKLDFDSAGNLVDGNGNLILGFPMKDDGTPDIGADGTITSSELSTIYCDPEVLQKLKGINISPTGAIIGILEGDKIIKTATKLPSFIDPASIKINPESNFTGPVKLAVGAIPNPADLATAFGLTIEELDFGTVGFTAASAGGATYDFSYDSATQKISLTVTGNGTKDGKYEGVIQNDGTVSLKSTSSKDVAFTMKVDVNAPGFPGTTGAVPTPASMNAMRSQVITMDEGNNVRKLPATPSPSLPPTSAELEGISIAFNGNPITPYVGNIGTAQPDESILYPIGNLALAKFPNPAGLLEAGSSYFQSTANSGDPAFVRPGLEGTGGLKAGYLEMSNVDVSKEFTDMITTQRGFQANSRIITVSDTMLEELVNLKR